jgi:hypothetical protein
MGLSGHRLMQPRLHRIGVGHTHTRRTPGILQRKPLLQSKQYYYKPVFSGPDWSNINKGLLKTTGKHPFDQSHSEKTTRLTTSPSAAPCVAQSMVSLRGVNAGRGRIPFHGPTRRNSKGAGRTINLILNRHT